MILNNYVPFQNGYFCHLKKSYTHQGETTGSSNGSEQLNKQFCQVKFLMPYVINCIYFLLGFFPASTYTQTELQVPEGQ